MFVPWTILTHPRISRHLPGSCQQSSGQVLLPCRQSLRCGLGTFEADCGSKSEHLEMGNFFLRAWWNRNTTLSNGSLSHSWLIFSVRRNGVPLHFLFFFWLVSDSMAMAAVGTGIAELREAIDREVAIFWPGRWWFLRGPVPQCA